MWPAQRRSTKRAWGLLETKSYLAPEEEAKEVTAGTEGRALLLQSALPQAATELRSAATMALTVALKPNHKRQGAAL